MDVLHHDLLGVLQCVEEILLTEGFDDVTMATRSGSWRWQTNGRARDLAKPPKGANPTDEEFAMAARLTTQAPQGHAKLSELIAGEFARRRLSSSQGRPRPAR